MFVNVIVLGRILWAFILDLYIVKVFKPIQGSSYACISWEEEVFLLSHHEEYCHFI